MPIAITYRPRRWTVTRTRAGLRVARMGVVGPPGVNTVSATDRVLGRVSSGGGVVEEVPFTDQAQALCDDTSFAAMRTTLGLATVAASGSAADLSAGTLPDARLADTGTAGTYRSVTTDAKGRVTAGTNPTTLAAYGLTDAQPLDAELTALAGLASAADKLPYFTGSGTAALTDMPLYARGLIACDKSGDARTHLGLGTLATQSGTFSGTSSGTNTGDQTITLVGDVTGSGTGSFAATIADDAVTYAKLQNVSATDRLLGRVSSGAGNAEEVVCTDQAQALLDDATAGDMRATLGLAAVAASGSATDLGSGTLADGRLSANVPLKDAANTFSAQQAVSLSAATVAGLSVTNAAAAGAATVFLTADTGTSFIYKTGSAYGSATPNVLYIQDPAGAITLLPGGALNLTPGGALNATATQFAGTFNGLAYRMDATGLGVGVTPGKRLHVKQDANTGAAMRFENMTAGTAAYAGVELTADGGTSYLYRTSTAYASGQVNATYLQNPEGMLVFLAGAGASVTCSGFEVVGQDAAAVAAAVKAAPSQTANLHEWRNSSGTPLSTVTENGYYTTRKAAAPADAELAAGELAWWFDATNGAAAVKWKGKTLDGTVVTRTDALA